MIALLLSASLWANTQWCHGLHEPYKHWPVYLEVTEQLDTCTMNWYTAPVFLEDARHWPMVWNPVYRPTITDLAQWAEAYPGRTWLLLNEPERIEQANTTPGDAAIHVRYWAEAIGDNGTIACCGVLVNPRWGGWHYWLDAYLNWGGPMPDAWHIHIYESSPADFDAALAAWDAWNAEHGGGLPTIISEVGSGYDVQEYAKTVQRDDIPAIFWFGLPVPVPVPDIDGMGEEWRSIFFPLTY